MQIKRKVEKSNSGISKVKKVTYTTSGGKQLTKTVSKGPSKVVTLENKAGDVLYRKSKYKADDNTVQKSLNVNVGGVKIFKRKYKGNDEVSKQNILKVGKDKSPKINYSKMVSSVPSGKSTFIKTNKKTVEKDMVPEMSSKNMFGNPKMSRSKKITKL